jgi:hypothetical protein
MQYIDQIAGTMFSTQTYTTLVISPVKCVFECLGLGARDWVEKMVPAL